MYLECDISVFINKCFARLCLLYLRLLLKINTLKVSNCIMILLYYDGWEDKYSNAKIIKLGLKN